MLCGISAGMLLLDVHKVSIAIPSIESALLPGPVWMQLISAAYVVCFAVTLVPAGRMGDAGRRLTLTYAGLWLSLAASIVCAIAPNAPVLVAGRAVLGVAAGLLMPQLMGIVQQLFAPADRGRAFGTYGMCVAVATALGPSVGGLLMTTPLLGWRGIFVMNIPVVVGLLIAAHRLLPRIRLSPADGPEVVNIDVAGLVLGGLALVLLLTPLIFTTGRPGEFSSRWLALVPALVLAFLFVRRSRARVVAGLDAVIDPTLLRIRSFRNGVLVSLTWFASGPGVNLGLTIYLQQAHGFSPAQAGLVTLPSFATSLLGAYLGGRLVARWGRVLTITGMTSAFVGIVLTLVAVHTTTSVTALLIAVPALQLLSGLGSGLVVSPNHSMTLQDVPPTQGSAASAIGQLGQRVANSLGVAAASMAYYSTIYGPGWRLSDAPSALHRSAYDRSTTVALLFLLLAFWIVCLDYWRQRRVSLTIRRDRLPAKTASDSFARTELETGPNDKGLVERTARSTLLP